MDPDDVKRFLRELAPEARSSFAGLVNQEPVKRIRLRDEIKNYLGLVKASSLDGSPVDYEGARKVAKGLVAMLGGLGPDTPTVHRELVQAACRYFTLDDDGSDDFDSSDGFDDDTDVFNAVAEEIGREELVIDWF